MIVTVAVSSYTVYQPPQDLTPANLYTMIKAVNTTSNIKSLGFLTSAETFSMFVTKTYLNAYYYNKTQMNDIIASINTTSTVNITNNITTYITNNITYENNYTTVNNITQNFTTVNNITQQFNITASYYEVNMTGNTTHITPVLEHLLTGIESNGSLYRLNVSDIYGSIDTDRIEHQYWSIQKNRGINTNITIQISGSDARVRLYVQTNG